MADWPIFWLRGGEDGRDFVEKTGKIGEADWGEDKKKG